MQNKSAHSMVELQWWHDDQLLGLVLSGSPLGRDNDLDSGADDRETLLEHRNLGLALEVVSPCLERFLNAARGSPSQKTSA